MTEVLIEVVGAVARLTLNRPEARNAVNGAMTRGLRAAMEAIEADPAIRAVVLTGAGPAFCAGMDLKAFAQGEGAEVLSGAGQFAGFVARARQKPVIAAVQGAALAGGFEIALACDLIVAAPEAIFGLPEAKRGLFAGAGGVLRLAHRIPRARAVEMILTGRPITAQEAFDYGLVVDLSADPVAAAMDLAREIAANAPLSVSMSLELLRAAGLETQALWAQNDAMLAQIAGSQDAMEGAVAFAQKRAPIWKGC